MLRLYQTPLSVCAHKVRMVLAEKGLKWEPINVDLTGGAQFDPAYLELNPKAVVPTLIHDGRVIRESTVICEYLDEVFPDPPLKPAEALDRARMRLWTKALDEGVHAACAVVSHAGALRDNYLKYSDDELEAVLAKSPDQEKRDAKRGWIRQGAAAPDVAPAIHLYDKTLAEMEKALAQSPWLAGPAFSLADIALTPYVVRLDMMRFDAMWTASRPRVTDWFARIKQRPSYVRTFVQDVPERAVLAMGEGGVKSWPAFKALLAD